MSQEQGFENKEKPCSPVLVGSLLCKRAGNFVSLSKGCCVGEQLIHQISYYRVHSACCYRK